MPRELSIAFTRSLIVLTTGTAVTVPLAYLLVNLARDLFIQYPTLHLLTIGAAAMAIAIFIALITPRLKKIIDQKIFPGSYNYQAKLKDLAAKIDQSPNIKDRIVYCCDNLKNHIGLDSVLFLEQPRKDMLCLELKPKSKTSAWLCFGKKINGDAWTRSDARLLKWFVSSVSVTLSLERERIHEQKRLEQVKLEVAKSTKDLEKLNEILNSRERNLAQQLDELAHDLKNPIAVMTNSLAEAASADISRKSDNKFSLVQAEVAWMTKCIDHLLDLARAEAGKVIPELRLVNLREAVEEARDHLQNFSEAQNKSINWSTISPTNTQVDVFGDERLIHQLLKLFLARSVRLTKKNVEIQVITDMTGDNAYVDVTIEPDKNLSTKDRHQLLDKFSRERSHHEDRKYGITGLELALARWILRAHQGSLSITEADRGRLVLRASFPTAAAKKERDSILELTSSEA